MDELKDNDNILDRIREILGDPSTSFSILEHQIDIKVQMEYFEYSKSHRSKFETEDVLAQEPKLYDQSVPLDEKKLLLVKLASIDKPEAYRVLERFSPSAPADIKDWAVMATQESRMLLESQLLDEQQVFISTGLGGKDGKLRYYVVAFPEQTESFTASQQKLIESEFEYSLKQSNAEIESLEFTPEHVCIMALVPLSVQVRLPFKKAIDECNSLGRFIKDAFIITNVKKLTDDEIKEIVSKPSKDEGEE